MKTLPITYDERLSRIIKVAVLWFKAIGLAPFSLKRTETPARSHRNARHLGTFVFSKIGLVYNSLLLILIIAMGVLAIPHLAFLNYANKSFVTQTIDVMLGILRTFTSCVIVVSWGLRQEMASSIANRLSEVNCLLSGMRQHPSSKRTSLLFNAGCMIFNALLWFTFSVSLESSFDSFPNWFVSNVPLFVINWFVVEYSIILGAVARALESLNKNLLDLKEFINCSFRTPLLSDYLAVLQSLPNHNRLPALQLLHTIRNSLYEVSLDIEEFFSLPILPCVASFFLSLIYNIYYLITPVVIPVGVLTLSLTNNFNTLVWTCISIYPLILLALNVAEILQEIELTGLIVHKLLAVAKKPEIRSELEQFSHKLLHEKVNFTAYGFFTLDFTLLQSIFGATATYLVIIIQYMRSASTANNT